MDSTANSPRDSPLAGGTLQVDEAVELGHAVVQRVADDADVRVLFIKGPSLAHHGLRDASVSSDVDALVSPEDFEVLVRALADLGWHERAMSSVAKSIVDHSVTLIHHGWPCDLDVHSFYPGFLAAPQQVFETLWARREPLEFASVPCGVPDRAASILIVILHALRSSPENARHRGDLQRFLERVAPHLTASERDDLGLLAAQLGCAGSVAPVFALAGIAVPHANREEDEDALAHWRSRVAGRATITSLVVGRLRRLPLRRIPGELARAVWPSATDFRRDHPEVAPGVRALVAARFARIGRGLRDLPVALFAIRRAKRGAGSTPILDGLEPSPGGEEE